MYSILLLFFSVFTIPSIYYFRDLGGFATIVRRKQSFLDSIKQYLTHYLSSKLIEMHHGYYIINYPFGVSWYRIIVPRKRGPSDISRILAKKGVDITSIITPFLGPYNDFHSSKIVTPTMLGYPDGIIIEDLFCFDKKEIDGNQVIN